MSTRQSSASTLSPTFRAAKPVSGPPLPGGRAPARRGASLRAQLVLALLCAAYAVGAAFGWGNRAGRPRHGRLRAQRRRRRGRRLLFPLRAQPPQPLSARLAAVRPLLRHGGPGQRRLGVVRGRPGSARARAELRGPVLPLLRATRHRRPAGAGQEARDQGRLGLPGAGLLAHRRLPGHPLLEPRARPDRPARRLRHRAHRALAGLPAARHRPGQHGARAALPPLLHAPLRGEHRDRRPRAHRDVRRPVHLAPAAHQLPLRPAPRRRLVRGLPAPRLRPLGRPAARTVGRGRARARGARTHPGPAPRACSRATGTTTDHREDTRTCSSREVVTVTIRPPAPSPDPWPRSLPTWPPPSAPWASSTTSSTAAASTAWCSSPPAPSCSPSSCARASCSSTTSPSPRNWPRRRTTSAPWCRAPATSS